MSSDFYSHIQTLLAMRGILQQQNAASLVDSITAPRQKSGKEIMAQALTGRLRSNAGTLRQAARNALDGAALVTNLSEGAQKAADSLTSLRDMAQKAASGISVDQTEWNDAKAAFEAAAKGTSYNGIDLMDGSNWKADSRLLTTGSTASLNIHTGTTSQTVTLRDYKKNFDELPEFSELTTLSTAASARDKLDGFLTNAKTYASNYSAQAKSLEGMAKTMDRQAEISSDAAQRSILGSRDDPAGKLLYYLLNNNGKLFDDFS